VRCHEFGAQYMHICIKFSTITKAYVPSNQKLKLLLQDSKIFTFAIHFLDLSCSDSDLIVDMQRWHFLHDYENYQ